MIFSARSALLFFYLIWLQSMAFGSNVQIHDLQVDMSGEITCHIQWNHAWKLDTAPANHDAVWLFAKINYGNGFVHLPFDLSGHSSENAILHPAVSQDGKGFMIRPLQAGSFQEISDRLVLRLYEEIPMTSFELRLFAIEMVFVAEGEFHLGDAASQRAFEAGGLGDPFPIISEAGIEVGPQIGQLWSSEDVPASDLGTNYPKGYNGFYCMKYELSQEQYRDFLNALMPEQQQSRTSVDIYSLPGEGVHDNQARNGLRLSQSASGDHSALFSCDLTQDNLQDGTNDGQCLAANFLTWADLAAYLDWAALRPMTELEYEKACRGPEPALDLEFAWGTDLASPIVSIGDEGMPGEYSSSPIENSAGVINYQYSPIAGPVRCGFAANSTSDRIEAGASYYGIMEMSGNLWEQVVNTSESGLIFNGMHGDGSLDAQGNANVPSWPEADSEGAGLRGGGWNSGDFAGFRDAAISDRYYINFVNTNRLGTIGGRGVRYL